jgi:crossover junction endodeoxyribonuclease RusA
LNLFPIHDAVTIALRLPLPPSANHYWRSWVRPGSTRVMTYVSTEGKRFRGDVAAAWVKHYQGWPPEPATARLRLTVTIAYPNRRKIDLDNRLKPLQDALTACGAWADDSQVDEIRIIRGPVAPPTGYADIVIEALE